jgi:predicted transposase YbfD/YdcC
MNQLEIKQLLENDLKAALEASIVFADDCGAQTIVEHLLISKGDYQSSSDAHHTQRISFEEFKRHEAQTRHALLEFLGRFLLPSVAR